MFKLGKTVIHYSIHRALINTNLDLYFNLFTNFQISYLVV